MSLLLVKKKEQSCAKNTKEFIGTVLFYLWKSISTSENKITKNNEKDAKIFHILENVQKRLNYKEEFIKVEYLIILFVTWILNYLLKFLKKNMMIKEISNFSFKNDIKH